MIKSNDVLVKSFSEWYSFISDNENHISHIYRDLVQACDFKIPDFAHLGWPEVSLLPPDIDNDAFIMGKFGSHRGSEILALGYFMYLVRSSVHMVLPLKLMIQMAPENDSIRYYLNRNRNISITEMARLQQEAKSLLEAYTKLTAEVLSWSSTIPATIGQTNANLCVLTGGEAGMAPAEKQDVSQGYNTVNSDVQGYKAQ